jgi:hypothetical protein
MTEEQQTQQEQQQPKGVIKTRLALLIFCKDVATPMVLYFDNNIPIPIREYMWNDYFPFIKQFNLPINNPDNLDLNQFTCID